MEQPPFNTDKLLAEYLSRNLGDMQHQLDLIRAGKIIAGAGSTGTNLITQNNGNIFVNGDLYYWQKGPSQTANGVLSADAWRIAGGGSTHTWQREDANQSNANQAGKINQARLITNSVLGDANSKRLSQRMEMVQRFGGKKYTMSFTAKCAAYMNIAVEFLVNYGTTSAVSVTPTLTGLGVTKFQVRPGDRRYFVDVQIPYISDSQLGTDGNDYLEANIWTDAGASFNSRTDSLGQTGGTTELVVSGLKFEEGKATDTGTFDLSLELIRCQRLFEKSFELFTTPVQNVGSNIGTFCFTLATGGATFQRSGQLRWTVTKRSVPTVTLFNPMAANAQIRDSTASLDFTGSTPTQIGDTGCALNGTAAAGSAVGNRATVHWTSDANL